MDFVERRDLYSQLLSNLISLHVEAWYLPDGLNIAKNSIPASRRYFDLFEEWVWAYHAYKKVLQPKHCNNLRTI